MGYKVLVVDDSTILRNSIKRAVVQAGVPEENILEAGHGKEALEVLGDHADVNLILLDLNMPVMDGRQFVAHCVKDPILRDLQIVVVTSEVNKKRLDEILALGVKGVLRKPFEPEDLREMVGELIGAGQ